MTPSPEERAKAVVRSLLEPLDNGKPYLVTPLRKVMAEVIAAAIREAENDALESAARAVLAGWVGNSDKIADAIRALKHPKET